MDEIKTKRRPSWGIYLLLSLLVASVVTIVFGNMSVQQINDELYMTELVERQQYIPFYKWFNGSIEVENPRLDVPMLEFNGQSFNEWFNTHQLVTNGDFSDGTTGWYVNGDNSGSITDGIYTYTFTNTLTIISNEYVQTAIIITETDKLYYVVQIKGDKTSTFRIGLGNSFPENGSITTSWQLKSGIIQSVSSSSLFLLTNANQALALNDKIYVQYVYAFNISTLITNKQYSPLYNTTFDLMTDADIKIQIDEWTNFYNYEKEYSKFPIYDVGAYGVTLEQIEYYYNKYLNYLETIDLHDVYLVYTNPEYNTQLGNTFVVQYQNVTKSVLDTIDNLKGVYDGFKNTLDKIGDFLS